jgi:hypothetical protein
VAARADAVTCSLPSSVFISLIACLDGFFGLGILQACAAPADITVPLCTPHDIRFPDFPSQLSVLPLFNAASAFRTSFSAMCFYCLSLSVSCLLVSTGAARTLSLHGFVLLAVFQLTSGLAAASTQGTGVRKRCTRIRRACRGMARGGHLLGVHLH